ncbi:G-protein coupled receptor family C group 5 member C-like isoform X2 [Takifugu rubripes]|uniref:G-protein coupled receptor family C group 5 member C-like isoform X2 n=1 Tax=Takifugu rubripes TaxID=31033 RepID=UPI001145962A|nr:G-protein coupled receptor family C group 5 member C-like isoform X2 [Takifugu rubripes]
MAGAPEGCGPGVTWVYYNMCDLVTAWGIVAETVAAAGVLACFLLFVILVASLPSVTDKKRKATVALQAGVLTFTLGLFGLTFAFIVGRYSASCAARRFLFGVLFAGCLACLMTHGLWLLLLGRRGQGPKSWVLCLGALALWLVEVIINTEWLIITLVRGPADGVPVPDLPCSIANLDFVASLTYVMVLLLAVVLLAFPSLAHKRWRRDAAFLLTTGISTMAIWVAWILMYTHGNQVVGKASWDDPTLAVAVVTNAWVFLFLYTIPEICLLTKEDPEEEEPQDLDHVYPPRSLIYDSARKEAAAAQQSVYIENKAFSMEEPPAGPERSEIYNSAHTRPTKPVSPYGAYNGQVRGCVYQPTEIALIAKGLTKMDQDTRIPRARTPTVNPGSGGSLPRSAGPMAS